MSLLRAPLRAFGAACALSALVSSGALAQAAATPAQAQKAPGAATSTEPYKPVSGQEGKDVVWVPTPQKLVDSMLDMTKVTKDDYLVDLGSGDGRTVITAAKRGIRAHGVEYNPDLVTLSQRAAKDEGVAERATFVQGDIFKTNFSDATVVTLFLLPSLNEQLRPILLDMKPGVRVASNTFDMGDWQPDDRVVVENADCESWCKAMLWIIPAKVAGDWKTNNGDLKLSQTYQMLTGTLSKGGAALPISEAKMTGPDIAFTAGGVRYTGKVEGDKISGKTADGKDWSATRTAK